MPSKHSFWWRRLQDVLKMSFVFVFRRHLQGVFETSWLRRTYWPYSYIFKRRLQDAWSRSIYSSWSYVFKTSSRHLQDVFKTSSRRLQDVLQRCLQYLFKTYHRVKLLWLIRFQDVFETFPIYRRICLGCTSEKFMISVQNLLEWQKFLKY